MTTLDLLTPVLQRLPARDPSSVRAEARAVSGPAWRVGYARALMAADALVLVLATLLSLALHPGTVLLDTWTLGAVAVTVPGWLAVLALGRCYEHRFLGHGTEETSRVLRSSGRLGMVVGAACFAVQVPLSRGYLVALLPAGTVGLLGVRVLARAVLRRRRAQGQLRTRVLLAGDAGAAATLALRLSGGGEYDVVGACVPGGAAGHVLGVPVLGGLTTLLPAVREAGADAVALLGGPALHTDALLRLSVELEGTGVELLIASALPGLAGSRVSVRQMAGEPLLHLDAPELGGARRVVKAVFDRSVAAVLLLLGAPLLLGLALTVRFSSRGPALFRQERVGRDGQRFRLYKFRTMHVDAEARLAELVPANESDGRLFKMRQDPRVTRVGRPLRKYSLDELPQLLNVLRGQMSLVGPRPPLPAEVAGYAPNEHRRLLVKPGMTGLWQVSGRSELSWAETVRLDVQYVETWSLALDLTLLARTVGTVLRGRGAY
ncbi:MAG: UDP-phosphate galactose phosphotransferase [Frankiales bacterium]|nr:UDP-phosphate galactose phosphotransferase [Frankiales bacterium]